MSDDLRSLFRDQARSITVPRRDLAGVIARGRRRLWRRRLLSASSTVVVIGLLAVALAQIGGGRTRPPVASERGGGETRIEGGKVIEDWSEQEEADVFAFRALASRGLMDPYGERSYRLIDTDETTPAPEGAWRVGFAAMDCAPRGTSHTCRGLSGEDQASGNALVDTFVIVQLEAGSWKVVDVEGNMLAEERGRVIGFTLADRDEPSHWEMPAVSTRSLEGEGEGFSVTAWQLWVGPYPTKAPGSACTFSAIDAHGDQVGQQALYLEPPRREFERAGGVIGIGVEDAQEAERAEVDCRQYTGAGWEISSGPEMVRSNRGVVYGVTADLVWRGDKGFTSAAVCRATLVDEAGDEVWEGSGTVEPLWRSSELRHYPYRATVFVSIRGEPVDAQEIAGFICESV